LLLDELDKHMFALRPDGSKAPHEKDPLRGGS
jgi:hypothetical protein